MGTHKIHADLDVDGEVQGTSLDINGNADISGNLTGCAYQGDVIASAYLDSDTAHLSTTQTFTGAKTFTGTVALTGTGRITGIDTVSADTDAASKTYVDNAVSSAGGGDVTLSGTQTFTGSKTFGTNVKLNFRDGNTYINSPSASDLEIAAADVCEIVGATITLDAGTAIALEQNTTVTGSLTADQLNLQDAGDYITFYGNNAGQHSISSRDTSGTASDDLRINSYGAVNINLDSNSNNTSAADFTIGHHGDNDGAITNLFTVNGENGNVTLTGIVLDGNTITGVDDSGEFTDNDAHIMTSAGINDRFALIASPTFTGTPAAPTAGAGTNTTQLATTAFVTTAVSNLVDSAPGALNTLNELAAALGDDASFSTTVTNSIATKLPLAGGTMTGDLTITKSDGDTVLIIESDSDNNNENDNPRLEFKQDAGAVYCHVGTTGNVNNPFTNALVNYGYLRASVGLQFVVNGTTSAMTIDSSGNIAVSGTVDGVDIATRDGVLTSTTTTANAALPKAGGTMSGAIAMGNNNITGGGTITGTTLTGTSLDINGNADISGTCVTGNLECSDLDIGGTATGDGSGLTDLNGSQVTTGTIASARLDADTAHLTTTQTFSGAKTFSAAVTVSNSTASTSKTTGAVKVTGGVGISGALNVGGDVTAFASSDERYKDNLQAITNPIDKVKSLTGYTFTWNDKHEQFKGNNDIGVVAQEVEKVLPEIVDTRDNGYKAVKYEKMVALLIEAVKDQQKQIDELKEKCNGCSR